MSNVPNDPRATGTAKVPPEAILKGHGVKMGLFMTTAKLVGLLDTADIHSSYDNTPLKGIQAQTTSFFAMITSKTNAETSRFDKILYIMPEAQCHQNIFRTLETILRFDELKYVPGYDKLSDVEAKKWKSKHLGYIKDGKKSVTYPCPPSVSTKSKYYPSDESHGAWIGDPASTESHVLTVTDLIEFLNQMIKDQNDPVLGAHKELKQLKKAQRTARAAQAKKGASLSHAAPGSVPARTSTSRSQMNSTAQTAITPSQLVVPQSASQMVNAGLSIPRPLSPAKSSIVNSTAETMLRSRESESKKRRFNHEDYTVETEPDKDFRMGVQVMVDGEVEDIVMGPGVLVQDGDDQQGGDDMQEGEDDENDIHE